MTEAMPPTPPDSPLVDINYETPKPDDRATLLVKLAVIFNYVMAGIDAIYALIQTGSGIFMYYLMNTPHFAPPAPGGAGAAAPPSGPPPMVFLLIYPVMGLLGISAATLKVIGATKLYKRGRNAWGWGLAAGIVGCLQLWCSIFCVLPMAFGIYTIVILSLEHV